MGVLFYVTFGKESSESYLVDIPIGESRVHRKPLIDREPLSQSNNPLSQTIPQDLIMGQTGKWSLYTYL